MPWKVSFSCGEHPPWKIVVYISPAFAFRSTVLNSHLCELQTLSFSRRHCRPLRSLHFKTTDFHHVPSHFFFLSCPLCFVRNVQSHKNSKELAFCNTLVSVLCYYDFWMFYSSKITTYLEFYHSPGSLEEKSASGGRDACIMAPNA